MSERKTIIGFIFFYTAAFLLVNVLQRVIGYKEKSFWSFRVIIFPLVLVWIIFGFSSIDRKHLLKYAVVSALISVIISYAEIYFSSVKQQTILQNFDGSTFIFILSFFLAIMMFSSLFISFGMLLSHLFKAASKS